MENCSEVMKILVVEDDASIRETIFDIIDSAGFEVIVATNGWEGWELFQSENPDIIITDIQMPVLDGFELTTLIRQQQNLVQKYIIMISGMDNPDAPIQALNSGANEFLQKPLTFTNLIVRLHVARRTLQAARDLPATTPSRQTSGTTKIAPRLQDASLHTACQSEMSRAARHQRDLSCMVLAIQNRQHFIDANSADSQEQWFRWAMDTIQGILRSHDIVDLFREDHIGVILPETREDQAHTVQKKLSTVLEQAYIPINGGFQRPHLSFAIAGFDAHSQSTLMLDRAADTLDKLSGY